MVKNGTQTSDAPHQRRHDIVLMDIEMPGPDLLETTRPIGAALPLPGRPQIVAMIAVVLEENRKRCRSFSKRSQAR